jgi:DNA polymerase III subunit delta'
VTRFADVHGQEEPIRMLRDAIAADRLHHALLFAGPRGVGKRATADALARFLFCEAPERGDSCGRCESCVRLSAGTHPDLHVVEPGGGERKTKSIAIEQVRELQIALGRRPMIAPRRIAIVDDAESTTVPAQNALLKTLEEPPGRGLLVLVSENAAALTVTVRSRCQRVPFRPLAESVVSERLTTAFGVAPEAAPLLAAHADGSLGRALAIDATKLGETKGELERVLAAVVAEGYLAIPSAARAILALDDALGGGAFGALPLLAAELRGRLRRSAELTPPGKTASLAGDLRALEAVTSAIDDLKHNANKALALERMLDRLARAQASLS